MAPEKELDRINGMWIENQDAKFTSTYQEGTLYFCARECKDKFDQDRAHYFKRFEGRRP